MDTGPACSLTQNDPGRTGSQASRTVLPHPTLPRAQQLERPPAWQQGRSLLLAARPLAAAAVRLLLPLARRPELQLVVPVVGHQGRQKSRVR